MEFEKNIIATKKDINDAFKDNFNTELVSFKNFEEKNEIKNSSKKRYKVLLRVPTDFPVPKGHTISISTLRKIINNYEKAQVKTGKINNKVEEKTMSKKYKNMSYEDMRNLIEEIGNGDYENFVKAVVSFEKGIDDIDVLDKVYAEFMDNDTKGLVHEDFDDMIAEFSEQEKDIDYDLDDDKEDDIRNINGNMATDIEIKTLKNRAGEKFTVANFSIAENDDMGGVKYTNCTAYNDKIDKVKNFKKGDFVHLFGKEKISYGKDDKEYVNLSILSAKMLKEKKVYQENDKTQNKKKSKSMDNVKTDKKKTSVKDKLKQYKEKADKIAKKTPKKVKTNER